MSDTRRGGLRRFAAVGLTAALLAGAAAKKGAARSTRRHVLIWVHDAARPLLSARELAAALGLTSAPLVGAPMTIDAARAVLSQPH